MERIRGWVWLPISAPLFGKSLPFDPGLPQRNAAPADILHAVKLASGMGVLRERGQEDLGRGQTVAHTGAAK